MANLTLATFVEDFTQILEENNDMFFSSGDDEFDSNNIINTIKSQGFWAGGYLRYFFDMELLEKKHIKLLSTQERTFGS